MAAPLANGPKTMDCQVSMDGRVATMALPSMDSGDFLCSTTTPGNFQNNKKYQVSLGSNAFTLQFGEFHIGDFCVDPGGLGDFRKLEAGTIAVMEAPGWEVVVVFRGGNQASLEQAQGVSYPCKITSRY